MTTAQAIPLSTKCAIEVWENSGDRTLARLEMLCRHYAEQFCITDVPAMVREALAAIPAWKRPETNEQPKEKNV